MARPEITVPVVSWALIPGTQIALIRLSRFNDRANDDLVSAIRDAKTLGAKAWIVDVRNNPGGLLNQAIKVSSQFLKDGNVLLEADAQDNRTPFAVQVGGIATDQPMAVLVNRGTASSAEIFAGAIQDHRRGTIIGETTFGTGTVLQPFALADGSELLLGTRQWLTPNGRTLRKQGITPDVSVTLTNSSDLLPPNTIKQMNATQIRSSADMQLQKALQLLLPESTP